MKSHLESSEYAERETPMLTCVAMSTGRALDALDGVASAVAPARVPSSPGP